MQQIYSLLAKLPRLVRVGLSGDFNARIPTGRIPIKMNIGELLKAFLTPLMSVCVCVFNTSANLHLDKRTAQHLQYIWP